MMNWLLWKDYRQNRLVILAALIFLLAPHLFALFAVCWDINRECVCPREWVVHYFTNSTIFGLMVSQFVVAIVAGNAFAGERADRSAEFLSSLPISRIRIVLSKLLFSLMMIGAIWLTSLVLLECLLPFMRGAEVTQHYDDLWRMIGYTAVTAIVFFCVAWCLSSFLTSTTFAVLGGLWTPAILWFGILFAGYLLGYTLQTDEFYEKIAAFWYCTVCLILAPLCFAGGTWYYLRRVEP
jgi:ABC-type transport system involved in multi-copper enzyme maturation permease subunit